MRGRKNYSGKTMPVWLVLKKDLEIVIQIPEELCKKANEGGTFDKKILRHMESQSKVIIRKLYDADIEMVYFKTWEEGHEEKKGGGA